MLHWARISAILLAFFCGGCAAASYQYGGDLHTEHDAPLAAGEPQIERGRRAPVLDAVGWVVGMPAKILLLNGRADNHNVSTATEADLQKYLAKNSLDKVKVRINQYDPRGEWRRLKNNESVGGPLRYTFGVLSVAGYTLLPGRIWGGDSYNPFTNTINIYSDDSSLALYQGGHAKDNARRESKGLYTVFCGRFWRNVQASKDALQYIEENGSPEELKKAYRSLYPVVAVRAVSPVLHWFPPLLVPALAVGHAAGQWKAAMVPEAKVARTPKTESRRIPAAPLPANARTGDFVVDPGLLR